MPTIYTALSILVAAATFVLLRRRNKARSELPLPPGPLRLPVLGNAREIPQRDTHEAFRKLSSKYGEFSRLLDTATSRG